MIDPVMLELYANVRCMTPTAREVFIQMVPFRVLVKVCNIDNEFATTKHSALVHSGPFVRSVLRWRKKHNLPGYALFLKDNALREESCHATR